MKNKIMFSLTVVCILLAALIYILINPKVSVSHEMKEAQMDILNSIDAESGVGQSYLEKSKPLEFYHLIHKDDLTILREIICNSTQMHDHVQFEMPYRYIVVGELQLPYASPFLIIDSYEEGQKPLLMQLSAEDNRHFLDLLKRLEDNAKETEETGSGLTN